MTGGDTVLVQYLDEDDGSGLATTVTKAVPVGPDCTPPTIRRLGAVRIGSHSALARWETDETSSTEIEYRSASGPWTRRLVRTPVTSHEVRLTGLAGCTTYELRATSADAAGNESSESTSFRTISSFPALADDFEEEGAARAWNHSGINDQWEVGGPTSGPGAAHSGRSVYATNLAGIDGRRGEHRGGDFRLTSPPIDLSAAVGATLRFWHWYDVWEGYLDGGGWIEASANGGRSWQTVVPEGGYPRPACIPQEAKPDWNGWCGSSGGWTPVMVDLSDFARDVVRLRFRFWEVGGNALYPEGGWFIDDVRVDADIPCGPRPRYLIHEIVDGASGNGDGRPDPGETVELVVALENVGNDRAYSVAVRLTTSTPGIEVTEAVAKWPDLVPGVVARPVRPGLAFAVDPAVVPGSTVRFALVISFSDSQGMVTELRRNIAIRIGDFPKVAHSFRSDEND